MSLASSGRRALGALAALIVMTLSLAAAAAQLTFKTAPGETLSQPAAQN